MAILITALITILIAVPTTAFLFSLYIENILDLPRYTFVGLLFNKSAVLRYALEAVQGYETNITRDKKSYKAFYVPDKTNLFELLMSVSGSTSIEYDDQEVFIYRYAKTIDTDTGVIINPAYPSPNYVLGEAIKEDGIMLSKFPILDNETSYMYADNVYVFQNRSNPHPLQGSYVDSQKLDYLTYITRKLNIINLRRNDTYEDSTAA